MKKSIVIILLSLFLLACSSGFGGGNLKLTVNETSYSGYVREFINVDYTLQNSQLDDHGAGRTMVSIQNYDPGTVQVKPDFYINSFLFAQTENSLGGSETNRFELYFEAGTQHDLSLEACTYYDEESNYDVCVDNEQCRTNFVIDRSSPVYPAAMQFQVVDGQFGKTGRLSFNFAKSNGVSIIRRGEAYRTTSPTLGDRSNICNDYDDESKPFMPGVYFEVYFNDLQVQCFGQKDVNFYLFSDENNNMASNDIICEFDVDEFSGALQNLEIKYSYYHILKQNLNFNLERSIGDDGFR